MDAAKTVTGAVAAHPGLEGWLPAAFLGHQRWAQIHAALGSGQLNEAKQQVEAFRSDIAKGRLPESADNKAILEQLAALKLPEDPFERVDWERTRGNRPFSFEINNANKEAVAVFASGARVTFILPPTGVAARILIAREELSAKALAAVLNGNPGLFAAWLELRIGNLQVARTGSEAKAARVASVWNNVAASGGKASTDVPRIREGSAYSEVGSGPFNASGVELPANCVSAAFAEAAAAAVGCRLLSPAEWAELQARLPEQPFPATPKSVKALCKKLEELWAAKRNGGLLEEDFGWLATGVGGTMDRGTGPFFQSVSAGGSPQALRHWHGNVAEYLRDPQTGALSVAGGSFANPNIQPQPLGEKEKTQAYIDAGLRLVLDRVDMDQLGQAQSLLARIRLAAP